MESNYPKAIKEVIENLSKMPGIGKKTAFRLTFFLINSKDNYVFNLANSLVNLKKNIQFCKKCFNFSTKDYCEICANNKRNNSILCVVESVVDLYTIEQAGGFNGYYHVLHGAISPIDGILPHNIKIKELIKRLKTEDIKELIIATNPTSEGNATASYIIEQIEKHIKKKPIISRIATGIPVGAEMEYIDKITILKALENRNSL